MLSAVSGSTGSALMEAEQVLLPLQAGQRQRDLLPLRYFHEPGPRETEDGNHDVGNTLMNHLPSRLVLSKANEAHVN